MKGWSRAGAKAGGWQPPWHPDPTQARLIQGGRNFAWEDPEEQQPEEEFGLQQKSRFGRLNGSPGNYSPRQRSEGSILCRQQGEIPGNQADLAAPSPLPAFIKSPGKTRGDSRAAPAPERPAGMQKLDRSPASLDTRMDRSRGGVGDPARRGDNSLPCSSRNGSCSQASTTGKGPIE